MNNFDKHAKSSLDEWIFYLKTNELPNNYTARGLKEVEEKLKYDQMEPTEKKRYNKFMKNSLLTRSQHESALYVGEQKGIEKGMAEGREERNRQIVRSSFEQGLSVTLIAKITDLSEEEIERILKN